MGPDHASRIKTTKQAHELVRAKSRQSKGPPRVMEMDTSVPLSKNMDDIKRPVCMLVTDLSDAHALAGGHERRLP